MKSVFDWLSAYGPGLLSHGVLASLAALMGWRWWACRRRLRAVLGRPAADGVPLPFSSGTAPDGVPDGCAILDALLEGLPYRIFWKDCQLVYRGCNRLLACDAGRQTPDAVIGKTDYDLAWSREEARFYRQCDRQVLETGQAQIDFLETQKNADGTSRFLLTRKIPIRDGAGRTIAVLGIYRDVTEEERRKDLLALTQHAVDNAADLILWVDQNARILYANNRVEKRLGYSRADACEKRLYDLIGGFNKRNWPGYWQRMRNDEDIITESVCCGRSGARTPVEVSAFIKTFHGVDYGFFFAREILDRKVAEAELQEAHGRLVDAARLSGMAEISAGVLHNVGNVLTSVNATVALLIEQAKQSRVAYLPRFHQEVENRILRVVPGEGADDGVPDRMMEFFGELIARLESERDRRLSKLMDLRNDLQHIVDIIETHQSHGKIAGLSEWVMLSDVANDALKLMGASLSRRNVEVVRQYASTPPLMLDRRQALQILTNLIANASYALEARGGDDLRIVIRIHPADGNQVNVEVEDNGIGVAPENLTRIFHHGFTTRSSGHGFGLHSAALTAAAMGGTLTASSEGLGRGARFVLQLPISPTGGSDGSDGSGLETHPYSG